MALLAIHVVAPQRAGTIALTEVFEPYLLLSGLIAGGIAVWLGGRSARVALGILLIAALARCAPVAVSNPSGPTPDGVQGRAITWNVAGGTEFVGDLADEIDSPESILLVGLQELRPDGAQAIADHPELGRFPIVLRPNNGPLGMGLISRWAILDAQAYTDPPLIRAVVDDPDRAGPIAVFVVHPLPAEIRSIAGLPVALETAKRDADIGFIRSLIDADLAAGRQIIVLGDINTTEREPAYFELSRGLHDAHLDAGIGPGLTWRPPQLASLPIPLLRIDYVFVSDPLEVTSTSTSCSGASDHCRLDATIFFPERGVI